MTQEAWKSIVKLTLPGNGPSIIGNQKNLNSYTHCPSTKIKVITLWKGWTETEIHLFHKALMKDSLKISGGDLWRIHRDGEKAEN